MTSHESQPDLPAQPVVPPVVVNMPKQSTVFRNLGRVVLTFSILLNVVLIARLAEQPPQPEFAEQVYAGPHEGEQKIALVRLDGAIDPETAERIDRKLKRAVEDDQVKAILLEINSPGGGITASDMIYHAVAEADKKKPVVAMMEGVAASGGYYAAVGCRRIFAQKTTLTGSVGVLAMFPNIQGLLNEHLGITVTVLTAGQGKDTGSMFREMDPAEKQKLQALIDAAYQRFVAVVSRERPDLTEAKLRELGARIFTGPDAVEAGLVDQIGYRQAAIDYATKEAGISGEPKIVRYHRPFSIWPYLGMMGSSAEAPTVKLQVGPDLSAFRCGPILYLWEPGLPLAAKRE